MPSTHLKIAFIGWNPFQLIHVSSLIRKIPDSVFILEKKHNNIAQFNQSLLDNKDIPVEIYASKDIHKLDKIYDVIVCQTTFTDIHRFHQAKIAMLQYGYAKEAHNYGPWRSLADICFTYGAYASEKISYFCPVCDIGFLRKEKVYDPTFLLDGQRKYQDIINPNKKTILVLPTWGEHNSINAYIDKIESLQNKYNILVKPHHNTDLLGHKTLLTLKNKNIPILGANDDTLQLIINSDVIVSDYSGAIFDGIFCKKPVILLTSDISISSSNKVDEYSIEFQRRKELGNIVDSPDDFENTLALALSEKETTVSDKLYNHLYSDKEKPHEIISKALIKLCENDSSLILSQQQLYLRLAMQELYKLKYSSIRYKTLNKLQTVYSKLMIAST